MLHNLRKILILLGSGLLAVTACWAQAEQGAITGAVIDPTGASVPRAKVSATNQATGVIAVSETTTDGYYKIPYLTAGK